MNVHAKALPGPLDYADIEKGLPASSVISLIRKGAIAEEDVYRVISERALKRRLAGRGKLRIAEADAIARILRTSRLALWAFQDEARAREFLDLPNPALGNRVPRTMMLTDAGAREVEALLNRFVHGDYG